jgi:V/A-type H+/Na+-transporting ATPase subunit D
MEIRVNPTRMELLKLKKRVTMAKRGHRLLKDKRDQLMKEFLRLIRENKALREELETKLSKAFRSFLIASAMMSSEVMEEALMYSKGQVAVDVNLSTTMGVTVPKFQLEQGADEGEAYSYGFVGTSSELDASLGIFAETLPLMLKLSEVEKAVELLADEIEKTRRRVNALEYVMIPNLEKAVKSISMKLGEQERSNITRLMKIKDMVRTE